MIKQLDMGKFEEYISQSPVYEYRILDTKGIQVRERARTICSQECERFGTTWACPPAVGSGAVPGQDQQISPGSVFFQCGGSVGSYEYGGNAFHPDTSTKNHRRNRLISLGTGFSRFYPVHRIL